MILYKNYFEILHLIKFFKLPSAIVRLIFNFFLEENFVFIIMI